LKPVWKRIANGIFAALIFVLTIWSVFRGEDLSQVLSHLQLALPQYILAGILCVIFYILADAVTVCFLLRVLGLRVSPGRCALYSFVGFFYCCITPSASGGQPMQIYYMHKDGIPAAMSTVVLAIITVVYKLVLVLTGTVILLLRPDALMVHLQPVLPLVYLGMLLNIICILALLFPIFWPGLVRKLAEKCFRLFHRFRPAKKQEARRLRLERILNQYHDTAAFFHTHKVTIVTAFLIALVQRFALFLITWITYRAFSLSGCSMPVIVGLQSMIAAAADVLPLPGGMGVSENMFLDIYPAIFGEELVLPGMMISRGISYYTQLLLSALMTAVAHILLILPQKTPKKRSSK